MAKPNASTSLALLVTAAVGLALFVGWTTGAVALAPSEAAASVVGTAPSDGAIPILTSAAPVEPTVEGLPPAVARVLAKAGYLELLSAGDMGLPPAVVRVLAAHGVVLSVPDGALTRVRPIPVLETGSLSEGVTAQ
jgi:hypothetical protein